MLREKNQFLIVAAIVAVLLVFGSVSHVRAVTLGVNINGGRTSTDIRKVTLRLYGPFDVKDMKISNDPKLKDARWEPYRKEKTWYLRYNDENELGEEHRVYVRFRDDDGNETDIYSDYIRLTPPKAAATLKFVDEDDKNTTDRFVMLDADISDGIDAFRFGYTESLGGIPFVSYSGRAFEAVVSAGEGKKTIYAEFKDASGKVLKRSINVNYNPPDRYIAEGNLIKGQGPAVYYYGFDGYLHPFVDAASYESWYRDYSGIKVISDVALQQYRFGHPVCLRQGSHLIKFKGLSKVYAVEPGCQLRPIRSEIEAYILFGQNWASNIRELDPIYRTLYHELSHDITNSKEGIVDEDGDGVDEETEKDYGSSDFSEDTDKDGISDYEEIYYWFSDPNDSDTDNDGIRDGQEIKNGYDPISNNKRNKIPKNTYTYPVGSLVKDGNDVYYIESQNSKIRVYGGINSRDFKESNFRSRFVVEPPIPLHLPDGNGTLRAGNKDITRPKVRRDNGKVFEL